jgi:apolipoprotein N-acyltransferase
MSPRANFAINLSLALAGGLALRLGFGLHPVWWLAWLAPAPVLAAALRSGPRTAFGLMLLAGLLANSANFHYFALLMPLALAAWVTLLVALLWVLVLGLTRKIMLSTASPWSVLAYPLLWCAADTLLAHFHPDGNWSSLAYSQAEVTAAVQILALTGVVGLVFVMSLVPAVLALISMRGWGAARGPALCALALTAATFGYGMARVPAKQDAQAALVGLVAIDDFIGPRVPAAQVERVWAQYENQVENLARQGARIVVLPEKIAVLSPAAAARIEGRLSALAARTQVWLAAGIGTDDGHRKLNLEWLFAPDGRRDASYQKHHMAPPERDFASGTNFDVRAIGGTRYGLAICKDMHFAEMGRAYGQRQAQVMLVPAWDFGEDGVYAARLSALRGIESGFAMVRASREGLLTVTDAYGRVLAETPSAPLPGATLLARLPSSFPTPTIYARTGDVVGWASTVAAALMLIVGLARKRPWIRWGRPGNRTAPSGAASTKLNPPNQI